MMSTPSPTLYTTLFGVVQGLGVILIVLISVWLSYFRGGFAWSSTPALEFNWHPLLMTIGLIFFYGNSILVYRTFRSSPKRKLKLIHAAIHGSAFILAVIGLQAAFDSHNLDTPPKPNMKTLHSWIGLIAVIIFAAQLVSGFVAFLYPMLGGSLRASIMPLHVFFGVTGFVMAVAAALMGLTEKAIWTQAYANLPSSEWILVDVIGLFMVTFCLAVVYLVTESRYKRLALPEEEMILAGSPEPHIH